MDVFLSLLTLAVTAIITFAGTWWLSRSDCATKLKLIEGQLHSVAGQLHQAQQESQKLILAKDQLNAVYIQARNQIGELEKVRARHAKIKAALENTGVVRNYYQPVILAGPRLVGKSSLLMQWHAPWVATALDRTRYHYVGEVPVYDFDESTRQPYFADPEILVPVRAHLILRVHDFPGELAAQALIRSAVEDETSFLRQQSSRNLGLVLICLFDSEEAMTGISRDTQDYYNADLFRELRSLVAHDRTSFDRLILVFNKYDRLRQRAGHAASDRDLLRLCVDKFSPLLADLRGACNPEKICEVFTIFERKEAHLKNRGAPIVLGEAARHFVEVMAGREAAVQVLAQSRASTLAAPSFL